MTSVDTTLLETIATDSPELLEEAGLGIHNAHCWYDTEQTNQHVETVFLEFPKVESLLCWAMVKGLWENGATPMLKYDSGLRWRWDVELGVNDDLPLYAGLTPLAALYAAYLAMRGKP